LPSDKDSAAERTGFSVVAAIEELLGQRLSGPEA